MHQRTTYKKGKNVSGNGKMTDEEFGERMRVITVSSEAMEE